MELRRFEFEIGVRVYSLVNSIERDNEVNGTQSKQEGRLGLAVHLLIRILAPY
ncbi:MAG: hypothetical protein MUO62_18760 [Anaerolineales bacterium]|nr:hypothetical protein [Anaerolineales bacterium]